MGPSASAYQLPTPAQTAEQLVEIWRRHARVLAFLLAVTAAHNLPVLFTRMTLS